MNPMRSAFLFLMTAAVFVALLAATGCSSSDKKDNDSDSGQSDWRSEPNKNGHITTHRRWGAGPDGTIMVGNATCAVKGYQVTDRHFEYNGWCVHYCCMGCDIDFQDDMDDYAPKLMEETGIDIRVAPTAEQKQRSADLMASLQSGSEPN